MAKFKIGDKVKINAAPVNWPACTKFTLLGAEGTVGQWVDWPEVMDPYAEYIFVTINNTGEKDKQYRGATLIFHERTLKKI